MKLLKKNLNLVGSASTFEALAEVIKKNLYWAEVNIQPSEHTIQGGKVYDVFNRNGKIESMVIVEAKRWQLFRFLN